MTPAQLVDIGLDRLGDQVAIRIFCQAGAQHQLPSDEYERRKSEIVQRLKGRQGKRPVDGSHLRGNGHAKKTVRRLDLGWLHFDAASKTYKQVRDPSGGGTRKLHVDITTSFEVVLAMAQDLYFPDGQSNKGCVSEFDFGVRSFDLSALDTSLTVGEFIGNTKIKLPHVYMSTVRKDSKVLSENFSFV